MTLVVASLAALALLVRAEMRAARASVDPFEPDVIDDGLALAVDVAAHVRLDRPVRKLAAAIERFLDGSGWSPRRHRIGFGIVLAVACGLAFSFWHVVREGPPPDLVAPVIFTILGGAGVLAGYLGSLIPLRLLRPSDTIRPTRRSSDAARTGRTLG